MQTFLKQMPNRDSFQTPKSCCSASKVHPKIPFWAFHAGGLELQHYKKYQRLLKAVRLQGNCHGKRKITVPSLVEHLLPKSDCIFLQCKHIVSKDDDFIIPSLMKLNQELTGSEFIWVHGVEQYPFLCFNSYIFSVKFRWHWAPYLQLENTHTG